ncbi:unnamed protein product [Closterium sp. NIES-65]|nr:unnamed protein product [Closterium sp. NIES-65]
MSTPILPHAPPRWPCRGDGMGGSSAADLNRCHKGEYGGGLGLSSLSVLSASAKLPTSPALPPSAAPPSPSLALPPESVITGARAESGVHPLTHLLLSPFSLLSQQQPAWITVEPCPLLIPPPSLPTTQQPQVSWRPARLR